MFPSTITGMGHIRRLAQHYKPISEAGGVLAFELAVEPAREVAHRLNYGVLGTVRRRLPGRAVALDLDRHAVLVAVAALLPDGGVELIEIALLRRLQLVRDAMQLRVLLVVPRGQFADLPDELVVGQGLGMR